MKLSRQNAQKLSQLVWRERLRKVAIAAGLMIAVVALAAFLNSYRQSHADPTVSVAPVAAQVTQKDTKRAGRSSFIFHARLADGRDVDALSPNGLAVPEGSRVMLGEYRHKSGRLSYELIRVVP